MRHAVILVLALAATSSCLDEDLTLGEACIADDECLGKQICGRTGPEIMFNLPGLCVEKGDPCDFGNQLGCICDPGTNPGIEDDWCTAQPPRYQTMTPVFVICDTTANSPTLGQCIPDPNQGM